MLLHQKLIHRVEISTLTLYRAEQKNRQIILKIGVHALWSTLILGKILENFLFVLHGWKSGGKIVSLCSFTTMGFTERAMVIYFPLMRLLR